MAWVHKDPEAGFYIDEFGGTFIYEDCGQTLAEQFPEMYFQCPNWAAWLLQITAFLHGRTQCFLTRWDTELK